MSTQTQIERIQSARNKLRTKGVDLGICVATDNITEIANKYDTIVDRGTPSATIQEGQTYTINAGYYHGGTVTGVPGGGSYDLQEKTATPTKSEQVITPDTGKYGLSKVTVNPIPDAYQNVTNVTAAAADVLATKVIVTSSGAEVAGTMPNRGSVTQVLDTVNTSYTIPSGYHSGAGSVSLVTEQKTTTPTESAQTITPTSGKVLSSVSVAAIPVKYGNAENTTITADEVLEGEVAVGYNTETGAAISITGTMPNNGAVSKTLSTSTTSYTVPVGYHDGSGTVNITLEQKTTTPTEESQSITPSSGKVLSQVTVNPIPDKYGNAENVTVTSPDLLEDVTAIGYNSTTNKAVTVTGTMVNNGAVEPAGLNCGLSYTIPVGYHNGSGVVTANSLASQTGVDTGKTAVTAATMLTGYQGWVNGSKVSGTMPNQGALTQTLNTTTTSYTIPAGYHNGSGSVNIVTQAKTTTPTEDTQTISPDSGKVLSAVTVNPIPKKYGNAENTTATAATILYGVTAIGYDDTEDEAITLTGAMPNNGAVAPSGLNCGQSYTIPAGYHNGSGVVTANSLSSQTGVDTGKSAITAATVLVDYQGWVDGTKISGTMPNNGAISGTITGLGVTPGDTSYTIPAGFTTGGTVSLTNAIETALAAI